jgi:hypothetical protein
MGGRGPTPKPANLRQRRNRRPGAAVLEGEPRFSSSARVPPLPNPDGREFHPLTMMCWERAWKSEMSGRWLETDADGLGRLALLWDKFYTDQSAMLLAEIRLQEQRFGLSPLDRSRLQWDVTRAGEGERRQSRSARRTTITDADPRAILMAVK